MVHCIFRSNKLCACLNYADISIIFSARGIPVQYFGLIYFLLYLVSSVSSKLAHHFKGFHEYKMFMALLLMLTLTPLLMAFPAEILIVTIQRVELFTGYDIYLSVCCGWNLIGKLLQRENHVDIEKPRS